MADPTVAEMFEVVSIILKEMRVIHGLVNQQFSEAVERLERATETVKKQDLHIRELEALLKNAAPIVGAPTPQDFTAETQEAIRALAETKDRLTRSRTPLPIPPAAVPVTPPTLAQIRESAVALLKATKEAVEAAELIGAHILALGVREATARRAGRDLGEAIP